jgi:hypothetical protein
MRDPHGSKTELFQRNIDNTMEAIDSLLSITSADISEIRLMMDALLEAYLGKLILVFFLEFISPSYFKQI